MHTEQVDDIESELNMMRIAHAHVQSTILGIIVFYRTIHHTNSKWISNINRSYVQYVCVHMHLYYYDEHRASMRYRIHIIVTPNNLFEMSQAKQPNIYVFRIGAVYETEMRLS